jgi:Fe-S-cluster containining protein
MTECARCGDCCERIFYWGDWNNLQQWAEWGRTVRDWAGENPDDERGRMTEKQFALVANAEFILTHWRPAPEDAALPVPRFSCSAFDPISRLCTAHDSRPPICRGYPWYGEIPEAGYERLASPRCSFWADVPLDKRPGAGLRLLPILETV